MWVAGFGVGEGDKSGVQGDEGRGGSEGIWGPGGGGHTGWMALLKLELRLTGGELGALFGVLGGDGFQSLGTVRRPGTSARTTSKDDAAEDDLQPANILLKKI